MFGAVSAVFLRDLRLAARSLGDTLTGVLFFVLALTLFPLGVGAAPDLLARIGAGVIWVLALLAVLLSLERMWQADFEDGGLDLLVLSPAPLELLVLAKAAAHWLVGGFLLALVAPLLTVLMAMPPDAAVLVPLSLLAGTPAMTLTGQIAAALLLGARRGMLLAGLIVTPLYVPVLIFGVSSVEGALMGLGGSAQLMILCAMSLLAAALAPFATAAALRLALE
jgi:heme exporter protein B